MSLRHKLKIACLILLVLILVASSVPSAHAAPTNLNVSITVFEDTGTAGDRSDDTKRSFSGFYTATYTQTLSSSLTQVATRFTKVGEMNKVRVCWEQGASPTGTAYIRIETDGSNGGPKPSGTLADTDAEIGVSASSLPTSGPEWCEYTFPGPVTLSESNWYWIVIKYEPGGSETIFVEGSMISSGTLPANINFGAYYTIDWYQSTSRAYVAFVIPETTHSLPLYRYVRMDVEWAVAPGLNQIADLRNDTDTVYRIVMQIQPKGDQWKWGPDDVDATDYYIRDAGSTPSVADMDTSDSETRPQFIVQQSLGSGSYPDIFVSANEASEWDGKSSITLTERGAVDTSAEGDGTGKGINCDDGANDWDQVNDAIAQDNWQVIEFWFKLDDDWSVNDIAELRYWQEGEGGHPDLTGLRYRVKVVAPEVDTYDSTYSTLKDTFDRSVPETVYAKAVGLESQSGWLIGWDKRVNLTIDSNDIDSDLSDFPVLVHLSTSSGRNNEDVSFIFDELQSDANRKKIAVTKSDGTTQCYVEIEDWDDASEEAWLWVKVSGTNSISSTTDTVLYLYYDSSHADNTDWVGDTDSAVAQNVWDTYYRGVWHLRETVGGADAIKDSTSYNNDGTDQNGPTLGQPGMIDSAIEFDGSDDCLNMGDPDSLDMGTSDMTIEIWANLSSSATHRGTLVYKGAGGSTPGYWFYWRNDTDYLKFHIATAATRLTVDSVTGIKDSTWCHLAAAADRDGNGMIYINGTLDNSNDFSSLNGQNIDSSISFLVSTSLSDYTWLGMIDEVRISRTLRNSAWIKAGYESGRDDLLDFGGEGDTTETLRPSGPGTSTGLSRVGDDANWKCVDEAGTHDGTSTYVYNPGPSGQATDLYQTQNHTTGTGTIINITVHFVVQESGSLGILEARPVIRTHSNVYYGSYVTVTSSWTEHTETWTQNPFTSSAWTWQEIDELEIGIELEWYSATETTRCTQLWVVVNYPSPEVESRPHFDFKYYSDFGGPSENEESAHLNVGESPAGEWRSSYLLDTGDPTGTWGVKVFDTQTPNLRCSASFTVTDGGAPEFAYGPVAAIVSCLAIYLVKRHRGKGWRKAS